MNFSFEIPKECLKHDKEMSYYNHNYYNIDFAKFGDYILSSKCNVLYQRCEDDDAYAYYTLGYFILNENNKIFIPCFTWEDKYYFIK